MSENLDFVRSIYAEWERGDFGRTAGLHPEIAWAYVGGPEPSSGIGMAGMAAPMRDWLRAWDEWHIEATEYRELGKVTRLVIYWHRDLAVADLGLKE